MSVFDYTQPQVQSASVYIPILLAHEGCLSFLCVLPHLWVHQPCLLLIEVPTKTTWTAANAVVAAKQSTLLALARTERTTLKRREKATIAAMRAS